MIFDWRLPSTPVEPLSKEQDRMILTSSAIHMYGRGLVINQHVCRCYLADGSWENYADSKVHGANMGPIWGRQDPGGPHVGSMNFAIWVHMYFSVVRNWQRDLANSRDIFNVNWSTQYRGFGRSITYMQINIYIFACTHTTLKTNWKMKSEYSYTDLTTDDTAWVYCILIYDMIVL